MVAMPIGERTLVLINSALLLLCSIGKSEHLQSIKMTLRPRGIKKFNLLLSRRALCNVVMEMKVMIMLMKIRVVRILTTVILTRKAMIPTILVFFNGTMEIKETVMVLHTVKT